MYSQNLSLFTSNEFVEEDSKDSKVLGNENFAGNPDMTMLTMKLGIMLERMGNCFFLQ